MFSAKTPHSAHEKPHSSGVQKSQTRNMKHTQRCRFGPELKPKPGNQYLDPLGTICGFVS